MTDVQQAVPVAQIDWRMIAKAAGEHGVRYRTNTALLAFLDEIEPARKADRFDPAHPCKSGEGAGEIEQLAQFLHDEGGFGNAMADRTWPEHDGDTGQRGGGWVKIVPSDVVAHFRDVARRWLLPRAALTPDATQTREADMRSALTEARETFQQIAAALREHDAQGLAQIIAVAELTETGCVAALSVGEPA